jgi:hypothetical protein
MVFSNVEDQMKGRYPSALGGLGEIAFQKPFD